jgi:hypothetical protein
LARFWIASHVTAPQLAIVPPKDKLAELEHVVEAALSAMVQGHHHFVPRPTAPIPAVNAPRSVQTRRTLDTT